MRSRFTHSLESKSIFSLLFLLSAVVIFLIVIEKDTDHLFEEVYEAEKIAEINISVLDLNKLLESMQRNVSVYGVSGSQAIFDKVRSNNQLIYQQLLLLSTQITDPEMKVMISNLLTLTLRYQENLQILPLRYQLKTEASKETLPAIYSGMDTELTKKIELVSNANDKATLLYSATLWAKANHSALLFLSNKDYGQRRNVTAYIESILESFNGLSASFLAKYPEFPDYVEHETQHYLDSFKKAIQANRNYFALVNVVMAGDAAEFNTLVDKLTEYVNGKFNNMQKQITALSEENKALLANGLIFTTLLCLIFALIFHFFITRAIKSLANTFLSFIEGDFSKDVPLRERSDEIGLLAQAATEFKETSIKLINAKTEAENTSRIKSEFLANMSHEIRTPMNGILGMAQTLSHSTLNSEQKKMLDVINSAGNSLLTILNDILDLSKLEANKVELDSTVFSFDELCFELKNMFETVAEQKNIQFRLPTTKTLNTKVCSDPLRIKQVLINLLSNAIKFTEEGHVSLSIDELSRDDSAVQYQIKISDTGVGIPADSIDSLTEAFTQADTSITRSFGGTGLGLAISSNILALFNSRLHIQSTLGKGAEFSFTLNLPLAEETHNCNDNPQLINSKTLETNKQINILIVDDSDINQFVLINLLQTLSQNNLESVSNGQEALTRVSQRDFDVVFMDMQMPVMDGITAVEHIRQQERFTDLYIIGLSANVLEEDRQKCIDAGMNDFLRKPLLREDLIDALTSYLSK